MKIEADNKTVSFKTDAVDCMTKYNGRIKYHIKIIFNNSVTEILEYESMKNRDKEYRKSVQYLALDDF